MIRKPGGVGRTASRPSGADLGFTLSETIVVVFLVGIVTAIVINSVQNSVERARMASCMSESCGASRPLPVVRQRWRQQGDRSEGLLGHSLQRHQTRAVRTAARHRERRRGLPQHRFVVGFRPQHLEPHRRLTLLGFHPFDNALTCCRVDGLREAAAGRGCGL